MTLTKKTVPQIKSELDDLGIVYRSNLRKAELLSLLEASKAPEEEEDTHYSPPYTRRRTTMATVDLQTVTSNLLKLEGSPLNHASAVIDELEAAQSEEVSVDVQITKEEVEIDEQVVQQEVVPQEEEEVEEVEVVEQEEEQVEEQVEEVVEEEIEVVATNGVSSEENVSEVTDSDNELEKDAAEVKQTSESVVKTKTVKRRSERIRKKHGVCSGALFSDDELPEPAVEADNISTTSSQEARDADRRSKLLRIFLLFILLAVISNTLIYIYNAFPAISDKISNISSSLLGLFKSDSSQAEL